jgi:hypothetical protein
VPGVNQQDLYPGKVLEQVAERLPVVSGRLLYHARDLLGSQVIAQREDLPGHRTPGRDGLGCLAPASPGDAHADLRVRLGDVHPRTAGVHDFHGHLPHIDIGNKGVRHGEGREKNEV